MVFFEGRLQLIKSVLFGMQVYWTNVFILPKRVIRVIEQMLNRFFWNGKIDGIAQAWLGRMFAFLKLRVLWG